MPLLDIAPAQLSLQNSLVPSFFHVQVLLGPWKIAQFHRRLRFPPVDLEKQGSRIKIRADATNELKPSVWRDSGSNNLNLETFLSTNVEFKEAWGDLTEKEKLRRMKISKANKGSTPWNKGRKHSDETRKQIRERTRIAMQDPKVRTKLINHGHAKSAETRSKIGIGVQMGWARRREMLKSRDLSTLNGRTWLLKLLGKAYLVRMSSSGILTRSCMINLRGSGRRPSNKGKPCHGLEVPRGHQNPQNRERKLCCDC